MKPFNFMDGPVAGECWSGRFNHMNLKVGDTVRVRGLGEEYLYRIEKEVDGELLAYHQSTIDLSIEIETPEIDELDDERTFAQQNDRGDLLWLDNGTHRPHYCSAEDAKKRGYVPLYVEIHNPVRGRRDA